MKTLATRFDRAGYSFEQLKREGNAAIYRKRSIESGHTTLEVIEVKPQEAREAFGKSYPAKEMYPGDGAWGKQGWTCVTQERANARFEGLKASLALRESNRMLLQADLGINSGS